MSETLTDALIAAAIISLLSFVGVLSFTINKKLFHKISQFFVAFSTGALLGGAFLHLLPEAVEGTDSLEAYVYVLVGIAMFYILERFLKWRHCHVDGDECSVHSFTYMSLLGDGIHNFIDGLIIVSAFYINREVGVATAIALAFHEIPQELGDFGVLMHGGFSRMKALLWNFASATMAMFGVVVGFFVANAVENISLVLLPLAAGGFIYISMSDLIPELHKESSLKKSLVSFSIFVFGLVFMYLTKIIFE